MADYVPALKACMGDWQYYVTVMKLGKVARECKLAEEIHANKDLDALIQREIQDRVKKEMVPYLLKESQRFYGALVVAVYGGNPDFSPVRVAEHELIDDRDQYSYGFGLLRFDGSQIYYALDGQHRLKSIQEAIAKNPDLAREEISVIILKHEQTKDGLERTRRLFSTLNRRAKPTSSGMNIAIDEDDSVAIVSRRLVKENEVLKGLVLTSLGSKQISPAKSHDPYITTLAAFYETNEILLSAYEGGLNIDKNFKQFRASDDELDGYYDFLENIWMLMLEKCPDFSPILKGRKKPGDIRKRIDSQGTVLAPDTGKPMAGGSVFARPIGQFVVAEVIKLALMQGKSIEDTIEAIMSNITMNIDQSPWVQVIWNPSTQRIIGSKAERELLVGIISHALGLRIKSKVRDLKQKYRDVTEDQKASLLSPIEWSGNTSNILDESEEHELIENYNN
ncbi:DNA sulfur modification protein DndB [Nodularia spumigena]|uniref:DNA sulfur modification protein DndB n=1 Tax=Nodularia spumigena UHCC 0060 TaxID=3110300 RepID=A0ABU5UNP7_NODSP|nr:DNA sulfur modification protein DndB [Nodularia spumigena]MEA5525147.1 DNA sulfur modification protein DndB [Nodularia spumigena UHCC 0143]MEA5607909.1 DNA sulfur modification protein DndB [Nodularia spumigena UHCC 0060]MEA5612795.1 DNA sulfur modification protein DndB [Nodularia spumigena UHCC 0040]